MGIIDTDIKCIVNIHFIQSNYIPKYRFEYIDNNITFQVKFLAKIIIQDYDYKQQEHYVKDCYNTYITMQMPFPLHYFNYTPNKYLDTFYLYELGQNNCILKKTITNWFEKLSNKYLN